MPVNTPSVRYSGMEPMCLPNAGRSVPHMANLWTRYNFMQGRRRGTYVAGGVNYVRDQRILLDSPQSAH
jgi:hypothetical protein